MKRFEWLHPVAHHIVGGCFDPSRLGFPFKLIPALRRMRASDARDWAAIRGLASGLAVMLRPAAQG